MGHYHIQTNKNDPARPWTRTGSLGREKNPGTAEKLTIAVTAAQARGAVSGAPRLQIYKKKNIFGLCAVARARLDLAQQFDG